MRATEDRPRVAVVLDHSIREDDAKASRLEVQGQEVAEPQVRAEREHLQVSPRELETGRGIVHAGELAADLAGEERHPSAGRAANLEESTAARDGPADEAGELSFHRILERVDLAGERRWSGPTVVPKKGATPRVRLERRHRVSMKAPHAV